MRTKRTDIHSPKNLIPENYEFVGIRLFKDEVPDDRKIIMEHIKRTGGKFSDHEHGGVCDVCGNPNVLNYAVFYHHATNEYIKTGLECADTISTFASAKLESGIKQANQHKYLETRAKKEQARRKKIEEEFLERLEDTFLEPYSHLLSTTLPNDARRELYILQDIMKNGARYGTLTSRQWAYAERLVATLQAPVESKTPKAEVVDGKYEITGKVVSVKYKDSEESLYPGYRMLVEDEQGRKYYGTAPAVLVDGAISTAEEMVGKQISFRATVTKSNKDPYFGYFKRPRLTKFEKTEHTEEGAA